MKLVALAYGLVTHALFAAGVGAMILGLATGLARTPVTALGTLQGASAWAADLALALQFPLLHTAALSKRGRRWLAVLAPRALRRDLGTTLYAAFASAQVLATFTLWSPLGGAVWRPEGAAAAAHFALYGASWLLLGKAMLDASLALQTGALGWWAVFRGRAPRYPGLPTTGLFAAWRQPIYTAFAATLMTAPAWSVDRVALAAVWGAYCVVGPRYKERRYAAMFGEAFTRYQATHPYWLPWPRRHA